MIRKILLLFLIGACAGRVFRACINLLLGNQSAMPYNSQRKREKKTPMRFFIIEILSGLALNIIYYTQVNLGDRIIYFILMSMLLMASIIDIEILEIPDELSFALVVLGLTFSMFFPHIHSTPCAILSVTKSLFGLVAGTGMLFWIGCIGEQIFKKEAIGFGDIKFIGAIGTFCGIKGCLFAILAGSAVGTIIVTPMLIQTYFFSRRKRRIAVVPFAPFLSMGAFLFVLLRSKFML